MRFGQWRGGAVAGSRNACQGWLTDKHRWIAVIVGMHSHGTFEPLLERRDDGAVGRAVPPMKQRVPADRVARDHPFQLIAGDRVSAARAQERTCLHACGCEPPTLQSANERLL